MVRTGSGAVLVYGMNACSIHHPKKGWFFIRCHFDLGTATHGTVDSGTPRHTTNRDVEDVPTKAVLVDDNVRECLELVLLFVTWEDLVVERLVFRKV